MARVTTWQLLGALALLGLYASGRAQHPVGAPAGKEDRSPNGEMICVSDFTQDNVEGLLGHPLGTVVRVTGEAVDGDTLGYKAAAGKLFLRVDEVNGTKLKRAAMFSYPVRSPKVRKPTPGGKFDYYVHEYGTFDGVVEPPEDLGLDFFQAVAHDGFHYRPYLTIHQVVEVQ
jgi:hypothetical protein